MGLKTSLDGVRTNCFMGLEPFYLNATRGRNLDYWKQDQNNCTGRT